MNLKQLLPQLRPQAIEWAESQADQIAVYGEPLNGLATKIALKMGVKQPELIRIAFVNDLPLPHEQLLRDVAVHTGLLGPNIAGITFGHSVLIRQGHGNIRLLSHELRHVQQYEHYGSVAAFLNDYLQQIAEVGYEKAPLELDARNHEIIDV
ncbi:hypothetical protein MLC59_13770 [Marinobacter bryozoorum]|uniref:hypothetical protein n=1 Tax=Marinobacter bryozoorum TaxID=256324 RepID=UPI002005482C|nr:hypothetical protein [Marinobacter bryozoorum]MCK7545231.1 hypothetical protein [Marinobacter bryozoorum]